MRLSVVLPTRLTVSALGLMLVAVTPLGAQDPQEGSENLAIAESVVAREEADRSGPSTPPSGPRPRSFSPPCPWPSSSRRRARTAWGSTAWMTAKPISSTPR